MTHDGDELWYRYGNILFERVQVVTSGKSAAGLAEWTA
jgi:hypothetical protein